VLRNIWLVISIFLLGVGLIGFWFFHREPKRDLSYLDAISEHSSDALALVLTANLEGYVAPCGCTSDPYGGIDRFAQVFLDLKAGLAGRAVLVDGGNMLFDSKTRNIADSCQDEAKIDLLLSTLKDLGLRFTMPGQFDFARGAGFAIDLYKKFGLQFPPDEELKIYPIDEHGLKISLLMIPAGYFLKRDIGLIKKSAEAAKAGGAQVVVVVSQMPSEKTKELMVPGTNIDIIFQAHTESMVPKSPIWASQAHPIWLEGGRQGQFFTYLLLQNVGSAKGAPLQLDSRAFAALEEKDLLVLRIQGLKQQLNDSSEDRRAFLNQRLQMAEVELESLLQVGSFTPLPGPSATFQAIPLSRRIVPNPKIKAQLDQYDASIPALVRKCEENVVCEKPDEGQATYVGVETCKTCHQAAYDVWKKAIVTVDAVNEEGAAIKRQVGHSRAWQTLVDDQKETDRSCVGCHSIGFMKKGGYCKAFEVDFRVNVQCESCHGPGSLHATTGDKRFITRRMDEQGCRECHVVPHISTYDSFNYEEKVQKILGPGHGEKLLQELQHKAR
jgi:hypothetical protein